MASLQHGPQAKHRGLQLSGGSSARCCRLSAFLPFVSTLAAATVYARISSDLEGTGPGGRAAGGGFAARPPRLHLAAMGTTPQCGQPNELRCHFKSWVHVNARP